MMNMSALSKYFPGFKKTLKGEMFFKPTENNMEAQTFKVLHHNGFKYLISSLDQ